MNIIIRQATLSDVSAINRLSEQLGYPLPENDSRSYLELILKNPDEMVFVAELNGKVIGWTNVFKTLHLVSGYCCELAGLVVDVQYHRMGVGKLLLNNVYKWSKEQGCDHLRVRTNIKRKDAHKFYEGLGFKEVKEQKVYEINL